MVATIVESFKSCLGETIESVTACLGEI